MAYGMKKRAGKGAKMECMAEGGMAEHEQDADMIARIMHKRKMYSEGGMVANETPPIADSEPAEFDDLVLDDHLEDNSGPGNEHGDSDQDERDSDVISRVMKSRAKKDRMPRPA